MDFTLSQEQYEALVSIARLGTQDANGNVLSDKARNLDAFLKDIEKSNGVTRSSLWIQWQEIDSPLPPTTRFPEVWPPEMRFFLEFISRPIAKTDVQEVVKKKARNPITILVTPDPGAQVGWTPLDQYFLQ
jgi:hypothetical protein